MTIAFDAASYQSTSGATSLTISHTVGAGTDRALVVAVECPNSTDYLSTATVTWNGTSMGSPRVSNAGTGSLHMYVWVLANPASGTHNIVVTPSASAYMDVVASSWTGVDQTTPVGTTANYGTSFGSSPTSTAISMSAGSVAVDAFAERVLTGTLAQDGTQTLIGAITANSVSRMGSSYKSGATAMAWSFSATQPVVRHCIVELKASAGSAATCDINITNANDAFSGSASVSAAATLALTNANDTFSGSASALPTITTEPLKNNTGTVLSNEVGATAWVYNVSTGTLVATKTSQTTDASGVMTITDAAFSSATQYRVVIKLASGAEGLAKYTTS